MKLSIFKSMPFAVLVLTFSIMSCGTTENSSGDSEYSEEIQDTLDRSVDINDNTQARKTRLSERIKGLEIEVDREITELDRKMENATAAEKVKWQIRREKLAMEREQLKTDLENVGKEVSNDWQQLEEDIADRLDRIAEDLRDDN